MTEPPGTSSFGDPGQYQPTGGGGDFQRTSQVNLTANTAQYQQQMGGAAAATQKTGEAVGGLLTKVDNLFKAGGRKLEILGAGTGASLGAGVASLGRLEQQMGSLQATSAVTGRSYRDFGKAVDTSFSKFSSSRSDIVGLVTELGNLSVKSRDISSITQTMTKLGAATGENIPSLTQNLVGLGRQFGQTSASDIGRYANSLLTVSKNAGVSATGVLQFAQNIAPIAKAAGIGQAAVLGISTSFNKAGADGFTAANTFNSMVNEISTLTKTGSPELVKYASLIGKTIDQFRRMPAKDQITSVFEALSKGDSKALSFVQTQGYGIRALNSIQAVGASGGLRQAINQAEGASGNQRNLNKGADAALGGLNDTLGRIRNQFVRLGDSLAGPLLTPVTGLARGFAFMLTGVNAVVKALGPLPGIVGSLVTIVAPIAGLLLSHASMIGGLALARSLVGRNSAGRTAVRDGRETARLVGAGYTRAQAAQMTPTGRMVASGDAKWRSSVPFYAAARMGANGVAPQGDPNRPMPYPRAAGPGALRTANAYAMGSVTAFRRFYADGQRRILQDSMASSPFAKTPYTTPSPSVRERFSAYRATAQETARTQGLGRQYVGAGAGITRALFGVARDTTRAGAAMTGAMLGAASGRGGGLARAGAGLAAVGRAAFSLPGMLAMAVAIPAISKLTSVISENRDRHSSTEVGDNLDPIKRYNDQLGIATSKLADFSTKVQAAGDNAGGPGKATTATTFGDAKTISRGEIGKYYAKGSNDPIISALGQGSNKGSVPRAVALMKSYGISDPRQLDLFAQNLLGAGYTGAQVRQVLSQYGSQGGPDYGQLATAINRANSRGGISKNPSSASNKLGAAALTSLNTQMQVDADTHSQGYAQTKYFRDSLGFLGAQLGGANSDPRMGQFKNNIATLIGGSNDNVEDMLEQYRKKYGTRDRQGFRTLPDFTKMDDQGRQTAIVRLLQSGGKGRDFLKGIAGAGGVTDPSKIAEYLSSQAGVTSEQQKRAAGQFGGLGGFLTTDKMTTNAIGGQQGNPGYVQRATERLAGEAIKTAGSFTKGEQALTKLGDTVGGAAGTLAQKAAAWVRQLSDWQLPYLSRGEQTTTLRNRMTASQNAANAPGASEETKNKAISDRAAYQQQEQANVQYLNSIYTQVKSFNTQQERSQEDYHTSLYRNERSFQISMQQSEEDYLKSRSRQLEDFNIQQTRAANAAAKSIYNPFERVQSQSVVNGGILLDNLQDENERIDRQRNQVAQLRKAGLSQDAVDTLGLADPNNAQQTNEIARTVANDPATIRAINAQITKRRKSTVSLTQSQFNEDFRNTVADFQRGLQRSAKDYKTQHDRATAAQKIALTDMATDFNTMVRRTGQDLTTQMTELYGNYAKTYARTLKEINKDIGKAIPDLDAMLKGQLAGVGGASGSGPASVGKVGSASNPNYSAGVVGRTANGKVGSYDSSGHFTGITGRRRQSLDMGSLPTIANPKSAPQDQVYGWLYAAGWPRGSQKTRIMHAIVHAESGNNPRSHNPVPPDDSYGLAQINMIGSLGPARRRKYGLKSNEDLYNPVTNLRIARQMSGGGSDFTPWTTYTRGAYLNYMKTGGIAMSAMRPVVGEAGREAVVPLERAEGRGFMTGMYDQISMAIARRMLSQSHGMVGTGGGTDNRQWHEDHSTNFTGPITVKADDPDRMEKELLNRVRTKRLTQPASSVT